MIRSTCALLLAALVAGYTTPTIRADVDNLEGGLLIAHYVDELVYSAGPPGEDWCEAYDAHAIHSLDEVRAEITTDDTLTVIWYVLAAWETEEKRWCAVEFGFGDYDEQVLQIVEAGPCFPDEGLELPSPGWPGPNEGTACVASPPWEGNFRPVYFFCADAYGYGGATLVPIAEDPTTGYCGFANCPIPPDAYAVYEEQRGGLGVNTPGIVPPWPGPLDGACCFETGECVLLSSQECQQSGGFWLGPEFDCWPVNPCPGPLGACCIGGECSMVTLEGCKLLGGTFYGGGNCFPNPCFAVCCHDHLCKIDREQSCAQSGGIWHPEWTSCDPNPCTIYTPARATSWGRIKEMYR